ncbi:phosphate transport system permease protein [Candidatus Planktophila lacus]|uniref:phosphate ABC transporter permease subunit PstC n=1 Tax=Candidatus Planktophila lacus TaxID=1884913 RepID=UPI000BC024C1|nr:phosphate ABC transporter permease subunit PstC [Candidatus Planktophila lacus]ASY28703.1 phosphate transport system permease protein [Candidatus Planktophila lacus]
MSQTTTIPSPRELSTEPRRSDKVFRGVVTSGGLSSLVILGLIALFLFYRGYEVLREEGLSFITSPEWTITLDESANVVESNFGLSAMLVGTILCSLVAVVIAVPISVFSALFLNFYAPQWMKKILVAIIDMMAAFPSILFGIWGFLVLMPSVEYWGKLINKYLGWIPIFQVEPYFFTRSPFVAGVVLAIMIIPIITSVSREIFAQAPLDRIQAAFALGATRWTMIKAVVIPHGRSGVVGGAMLGLGRAMGETVAVYTVLNIVFQINWYVLLGAGGNVASLIILKFGEASEYEIKALMAAGLVLFFLTLSVNAIANVIVKRTGKSGR